MALLLLLFVWLECELLVKEDNGVPHGVRTIGVLLEVGPTRVEVTLLGDDERYEAGEASVEAADAVATTVEGVNEDESDGGRSAVEDVVDDDRDEHVRLADGVDLFMLLLSTSAEASLARKTSSSPMACCCCCLYTLSWRPPVVHTSP